MFSVAAFLSSQPKHELYTPLKVNPDLRGYNYDNPELIFGAQVPEGQGVSITAMAIIHCPSGRDFYFDKRKSFNTLWWPRVLGVLVDRLLVPLFDIGINWLESGFEDGQEFLNDDLKQHIHSEAQNLLDNIAASWQCTWEGYKGQDIEQIAELVSPGGGPALLVNSKKAVMELVSAEIDSLLERIDAFKRTFADDWIVNFRESYQLRTEVGLDETKSNRSIAAKLGLNPGVTPDFLHSITIVGDLKTSKDAEYYNTVMAGYAIFLEAVLKKRVNVATVFLVDLDVASGKLVGKNIRLIKVNDSLRKAWRLQRDYALGLARSTSTPALPLDTTKCATCKYLTYCWINGEINVPNLSAV